MKLYIDTYDDIYRQSYPRLLEVYIYSEQEKNCIRFLISDL